jgi:hypothetical protein
MAEPRVTYEVWDRSVVTGRAAPHGDHIGFVGEWVPQDIANRLNGEEVETALAEGRSVRRKFIVVKATTTFEEVL